MLDKVFNYVLALLMMVAIFVVYLDLSVWRPT